MGKGLEEASSTAAELSDSLLQAATIWEHPEAPGIAPPPPHPLIPLTHPHTPSHASSAPRAPSLQAAASLLQAATHMRSRLQPYRRCRAALHAPKPPP